MFFMIVSSDRIYSPGGGEGGGGSEEVVGLGSVVGEPHDDRVRLHGPDAREANLGMERGCSDNLLKRHLVSIR